MAYSLKKVLIHLSWGVLTIDYVKVGQTIEAKIFDKERLRVWYDEVTKDHMVGWGEQFKPGKVEGTVTRITPLAHSCEPSG